MKVFPRPARKSPSRHYPSQSRPASRQYWLAFSHYQLRSGRGLAPLLPSPHYSTQSPPASRCPVPDGCSTPHARPHARPRSQGLRQRPSRYPLLLLAGCAAAPPRTSADASSFRDVSPATWRDMPKTSLSPRAAAFSRNCLRKSLMLSSLAEN